MDTVRSWFQGGTSSSEVPDASVLAEWTKYSNGRNDIEAGGTKEEATSLFTDKLASSFKQSFDVVTAGVSSAQTTVQK